MKQASGRDEDDRSAAVDLSNCDREPIHIPGAIQPHGLLFAFTGTALDTVSASANVRELAGVAAEDLLGGALDQLFDDASRARLHQALRQPGLASALPIAMQFGQGCATTFDGILHNHDGLGFLELEPQSARADDPHAVARRTSQAIRKLQATGTLEDACFAAAREVREITGFDRVKVYRFDADYSGEVIAEDRCDGIDSFLGLHFPASDIPPQARALYALNPLRIIPDIHYTPVPLIPDRNPATGRPIDLSHAVLRSVSAVHLEYMNNMEIAATLCISILRGKRLWGLIACHNRAPRHVGHDIRQTCAFIGEVLAWQIDVMEEAAVTRHGLQGQALQRRLLGDIEQSGDYRTGLARNSEALLGLIGATGLCVYRPDGVTLLGNTPPPDAIEPLVAWLGQTAGGELFQTDRLSSLFPGAAGYAHVASGLLAVAIARTPPDHGMLWFRPEVAQTVTWGGDPRKPARLGPNGDRLQPRESFAAWTEEVRRRALPWAQHEVIAAAEIRDLVIDALLRQELERVNAQLARSNAELEARVSERTRALNEAAQELAAEMRRREQAQAGLLQTQKLEALGQLTGGVAHDMNNVLAAIGGSYELMRRRTTDPRMLTFIDHGLKATERATSLVRRLVAFARREDLSRVKVKLPDLLADLAAVLPHSVGPRIEVIVDAPGDTWPVLADLHALEVALINLAVNARDAMPDGGTLSITTVNLPAGTRHHPDLRPGDYVAISVRDTGTGMPPDVLSHATDPFFTTKEPGHGSGMGLPMVHGLLTQLGGALDIASAVGEGTTVDILLPRAVAGLAAHADAPARIDPSRHGRAVILLVEDDNEVRPVTAAFLRDLGYTVIEASSAEMARALAATLETIDLIVSDVVMPGADGPTMAAWLRTERPGLPVLFVTGHAWDARSLQGETVLRKPFSTSDFELAVLAKLGRHQNP
jgi:light-regulated signal transduction histidine kinase (bacteriophytochrome)